VAAAAAVVLAGALLADTVLDALAISPESFRIATGLVLAAAGVRTMIWPAPAPAPLTLILVTPELTALAFSFGADEPTGKVLLAALPAFGLLALARLGRADGTSAAHRAGTSAVAAQFLAALQMVVAVALAVAGIRDV
jgi:hypothetical protein